MAASLIGGAALGAPFGAALDWLIEKAKKVKAFKSSFKDLVWSIERLNPIVRKIDSLHRGLDLQEDEVDFLKDTIRRAEELVQECSQASFVSRAKYTDKIDGVKKDFLDCCQIYLQLINTKNQYWMMKKIKDLEKRLGGNNFMRLCSPPQQPEPFTVGLDRPLWELKQMLFVEGTSVIVVCAPPGCGKTTLVTKLCHDEDVKGTFKRIFYVVASKNPNFRLIVHNLFRHNGYTAPDPVDDWEATIYLQHLLKDIGENDPILLVLDDVWHEKKSMLRNFVVQLPNYKILVTSSSKSDFLGFGSNFHLETLKYEDARKLLIEWAGRPDGISHTEYEDLLQKILARCHGYPLAIEVIGSSLKDKPVFTWKSLVKDLSEGKKILDVSCPRLEECLQTSVNALDARLKECFADLGSFPEDQKIRASTLVDIWVELYGLYKDGVHAMNFLEVLSSQNLLKRFSVGRNEHEDGFYNEYIVTQHHILRELAIHQSDSETEVERKRLNIEIRDDKFPDWCLNLTQPVNARLLSITADESFSSRWRDMNSPMVEALVLNFSTPNYALPGFIAKMARLKVLAIINHGFFPAKVSNLSCIHSPSDLKRIRFEKVSITSLDIGHRSLQKLSLVMCNIGEIFHDSQIGVSGALPSLEEIDIDYCSDLEELPYWICGVISLKKLSITNCNKLSKLPEAIGNLSNLEVLRLSSCIYLCELPETVKELQKLCHLDISDCLSLKKLPPGIGALRNLKKISMIKCSSCELPPSIQNLENLVVKCDEETAALWEQFEPKPVNLEINVQKTQHNLNWLKDLW